MLNAKQRRFVAEYQIDHNATQAAVRSGYSAKTAGQIGGRLLKHVEVASAIEAAEAERMARLQLSADEVLRELAALVRTNPSHFVLSETGHLALADESNTEAWRAVASVKRKTRIIPQDDGDPIVEHEAEYKLWDKNSAIDKAMKYFGLLEDRVRHTGDGLRFSFDIPAPPAVLNGDRRN